MSDSNHVVYELPLPSSAGYFHFRVLPRRACAIACEWDDLSSRALVLRFRGVEAFRCAYMNACTAEQIRIAYDRVVHLTSSAWLDDFRSLCAATQLDASGIRHLMLYLDDGPCYEFLCREFESEFVEREDPTRLADSAWRSEPARPNITRFAR